MERHHVPEQASGKRLPQASPGRLRDLAVHVQDGLEHALGVLRIPFEIQISHPRQEQAPLQRQLAVAGIHSRAQPHHHVAQVRIGAHMLLDLLQQRTPKPRRSPARQAGAQRIQDQIREPVILDDEPLAVVLAVGEIDGARDAGAEGLLNAVGAGVHGGRQIVRVRAPVPAEMGAQSGEGPVLVPAPQQQLGGPQAPRGHEHARGRFGAADAGVPRSIRSNTTLYPPFDRSMAWTTCSGRTSAPCCSASGM